MAGISTYPFAIFDPARVGAYIEQITGLPDTVIGHDVWLGDGAVILPGARIGSGVIVGAGAVVGGTVPDYAVVVGNPARVLRERERRRRRRRAPRRRTSTLTTWERWAPRRAPGRSEQGRRRRPRRR